MVFSSISFLFFFLSASIIVYYLLPRSFRNAWILIISLVFYGFGEPIYLLLMVGSILVNYIIGIFIGKYNNFKKIFLVVGILINVVLLGIFKYLGFLSETINSIFSNVAVIKIALPIGISFYTFQAMSYLIDVYRGDCKYQKNIVLFGAYISMFPQLIAGPIVRYKDIENQLVSRKENLFLFSNGVRLFTVGLSKKVLLANVLGDLFNNLTNQTETSTLGYWIAMIAFSLQIYFDFSGYSDMARGLGNIFGFSFVKNFDYPYISKSITEFWRRWHISLGTWFKEYVYIPLGGNRKGLLRQCLNIIIVWALTGLWHGASWNFVIWGVYYGLLLILEKVFLHKTARFPSIVKSFFTLLIVSFGWVIFQYTDVHQMFSFFRGLFLFNSSGQNEVYLIISHLPLLVISVFACLPVTKKIWYKLKDKKYTIIIESIAVIILMILSTASLVTSTYNPFLYFRF